MIALYGRGSATPHSSRDRRERLLVLFLIALLPAFAQERDSSAAFRQLLDTDWEYYLQQNPEFASALGDRRFNDRWSDLSLAAIETGRRHDLEVLGQLRKIDRSRLSPVDRINYDLFGKHVQERVDDAVHHLYLIPVNQRGGIQTLDDFATRLQFNNTKDYEDWIARLRKLPQLMDQTIALMREGMREHMLLPKIVLNRVPAQVEKQIVQKPEESLFYRPLAKMPVSISKADQDRLREQATAAIANAVVPSFQKFQKFFTGEYLPASFDQVGIWQVPNGDKLYESEARKFTTTAMTPKQIHEIGLSEVKRIRAEMELVKTKAGFSGSLKDFFAYLRTDPKFFYKNPEDLLQAYRVMAKEVDPLLVKLFKTLPRTPYGVEPIPAAIAPDTTTAYYEDSSADGRRPGTFFVNLYRPEVRPKWEMTALTLHESVPGHHLQIALAQEQGELPKFRRYTFSFTAFVEGWGLYAESLGEDMGLYDHDPYAKFGQLTYEMWRAVRLVVDTGIHYFHWDRQKAIDFFMENAPKTELDVTNEIDRYISWPGQALAYKVGELKFKELRARAQQRLGPRFNIREFHDVVLSAGALPLDVLEARVNTWIDGFAGAPAQKASAP
jgi:uncharacterized protein (DUF885 family)